MNEIITERPNLFEPNVYITVCVELAGKVCLHKLTTAIKEAYQANEATMSGIVLNNGVAYYQNLSVTGCKTEIIEKNWIEIVKDIMSVLSGVHLTYKPLALLTKNSFPQKALTVLPKLYVCYCKRKWKSHFFTWVDYYDLHNKYWETVSSDIQYKTLSVAETEQIIKNSKHIGCSVNSYIVTKLLQKHQNKCEVGIPVSIRENGNEAMSNLTSGISVNYQFNTRKTFEKNAIRVHGKIKKALRLHGLFVLQFLAQLPPTLIDAVLLSTHQYYANHLVKQTAVIMGYTGNRTRDLGITNLTVIDTDFAAPPCYNTPITMAIQEILHIIFQHIMVSQ